MLKEFFIKQAIQSKLKDVPPEMRDKLLAMVQKNPDFFVKIAGEIKEKLAGGMEEMTAAMEVIKSHQSEFEELNKK